jgi:Ser/Thr protein kinase RdoA (MazF antagonist)
MPLSDADLATGLPAAFGRPVELQARREWMRRSSLPMEELRIDGEWMLFKDLWPVARAPRPAFMVDPLREIAVYRELLEPAGVGAPALRGSLADLRGRRAWLFLERVDGVPLDEARDLGAWEEAARWLAALHARPVPAAGTARLLRYDAAWLRRWPERAMRRLPALRRLRGAAERAVERVLRWPRGLVHGEYYAANVLVAGERIRPVDWETAGLGPGLLDVAALTSGGWEPRSRARVERAYREALPADRRPTQRALADALRQARLLVALQWLGWDERFSTPEPHAHDWLAEAWRLAGSVPLTDRPKRAAAARSAQPAEEPPA